MLRLFVKSPSGGAHRSLATRPVNAVTGGDWDGTGVIPDLETSSILALPAAHLAALRKLPERPDRKETIAKLEKSTGAPI